MLKSAFHKLNENQALKLTINPGIPLLVLGIMIFCALFAPFIAPNDPYIGSLYDQFIPPYWMEGGSGKYILGTDYFGRCTLSRLIYGARISISIAVFAIFISALLGTLVGLISGYMGGMVDNVIMRVVDAMISIPYIVIAIVLAATLGASFLNVILVLSVFQWPFYTRQIRAEALAIKEQDFIALAEVAGASPLRILYKHFFFNVVPTLLVLSTLHIGELILWEATLSFLGVGVPPPTASWGSMVSEGKEYISHRWWLSMIPGIAILLIVLAANTFGDWIRDRLDPKLRQL